MANHRRAFYYGKNEKTCTQSPQIEDWQNRPLDEVNPILYIDAIHYTHLDMNILIAAVNKVIPESM